MMTNHWHLLSTILFLSQTFCNAFLPHIRRHNHHHHHAIYSSSTNQNQNPNENVIISPFSDPSPNDVETSSKSTLDLTVENVEWVLDEMRPFLQADGGDVALIEIDGPVVKLELQGACGTCPSSTQTMKMGLERGLRERIPEIQEVVQTLPEGPELNEEQVDVILNGVRPFLKVAGGNIQLVKISGEGGLQPTILLKMEGASATLNSVKLEIVQRLQRHFMLSGLRVEWE